MSGSTGVQPSAEAIEALAAENARLRKLIEPKEWLGWEQVDSIYEEARLLRRERDEAHAAGVAEGRAAMRDEIETLFADDGAIAHGANCGKYAYEVIEAACPGETKWR